MSIGLYDADLQFYPIPFYNLELMKLSSFYKRKREIVGLSLDYSPQRHSKFIVRQDFYSPIQYPPKTENVSFSGRAFDGETYKPLPLEIEIMKPDISLYSKVNPNEVKGYSKNALSTMRRAEHLRLSLDGTTIWNDYNKQLSYDSNTFGVILHDYNLNSIKGARSIIESEILPSIPLTAGRRIGTKYPIIVNNKEDLLAWLKFQPMGTYYSLTHKGLIDESYIEELNEVKQISTAIRQTSVDISDNFTYEELINGGLQRIFRNIINLRSHQLFFPLIYNESIFINDDWKLVMKLINRYNEHLLKQIAYADYFPRVEPYETLFSYCKAAIKQYHITEPLLSKETIEHIFQFVRENDYELFKDFYEYKGGEVRSDR